MPRRTQRQAGPHGGGGAPSQRQLRVGELIRRTLSAVLARGDVHDPDLASVSITVGEVRASPDLRVATVHVLPLGGRDAEGAIEALRRNRHEIRRLVSKDLALKFSPELRFAVDDTFDRLDDARRLFDQDAVRRDVDVDDDGGGGEPRPDGPPEERPARDPGA